MIEYGQTTDGMYYPRTDEFKLAFTGFVETRQFRRNISRWNARKMKEFRFSVLAYNLMCYQDADLTDWDDYKS